MSFAILNSRAQLGIDAPPVTVEVFLSGGLPSFSVVGMAETAVRESKDRVRSALITSGFKFPRERITVSLGPADMRKSGGRFDLAIALGILAASKNIPAEALDGVELYGELGLNGELRPVPAILTAAIRVRAAGRSMIAPTGNGIDAAIAGARVYAAGSLLEVTAHCLGRRKLGLLDPVDPPPGKLVQPDLADVKGQGHARRALEIAASGGHNLLFIGPPGTGKSMLARRLPGILPPMSETEALETAAIDSVLGRTLDLTRWRRRPFRAPHHTASAAAIVGGGPGPKPGEISRAHNGVLFLDELPEFNRNVLEVLREPLETGTISIARANRQADYLANFQLLAAMNPCPCGYLGDTQADCRCSAERVATYRSKISGPLLDRIDLHIEVTRPPKEVLRPDSQAGESSAEVGARVGRARQRQMERAGVCNARLDDHQLERYCRLDERGLTTLEAAVDKFNLSARAYQRVRRVARTIADLAGSETIGAVHIAEALSLRQLDKRIL